MDGVRVERPFKLDAPIGAGNIWHRLSALADRDRNAVDGTIAPRSPESVKFVNSKKKGAPKWTT